MEAFRLADLSKRKPEFQVSHNCLRRTLCKDSDQNFELAMTSQFKFNSVL